MDQNLAWLTQNPKSNKGNLTPHSTHTHTHTQYMWLNCKVIQTWQPPPPHPFLHQPPPPFSLFRFIPPKGSSNYTFQNARCRKGWTFQQTSSGADPAYLIRGDLIQKFLCQILETIQKILVFCSSKNVLIFRESTF